MTNLAKHQRVRGNAGLEIKVPCLWRRNCRCADRDGRATQRFSGVEFVFDLTMICQSHAQSDVRAFVGRTNDITRPAAVLQINIVTAQARAGANERVDIGQPGQGDIRFQCLIAQAAMDAEILVDLVAAKGSKGRAGQDRFGPAQHCRQGCAAIGHIRANGLVNDKGKRHLVIDVHLDAAAKLAERVADVIDGIAQHIDPGQVRRHIAKAEFGVIAGLENCGDILIGPVQSNCARHRRCQQHCRPSRQTVFDHVLIPISQVVNFPGRTLRTRCFFGQS